MNKNLIVQLQEVANDNNLKVFGQLIIGKPQTSNTADSLRWFIFVADGPVTVKNLDDITMTSRYDERTGTELAFESGRHSILLTEDAQSVMLESKYNITNFIIEKALFFKDIAELAYMPASIYNYKADSTIPIFNSGTLNKLSSVADGSIDWKGTENPGDGTVMQFGADVTGDIVNLKKFHLGNPVHIRLRNSNVYGDLSVFADCDDSFKANMVQISTNGSNKGKIYGNIEAFEDYTVFELFGLQGGISISGSVVTALSNSKNIREIAIDTDTGAEDLAPMFDAWYNAGRTSGTCEFWIPNKTVNGNAVSHGVITFTENGWSLN